MANWKSSLSCGAEVPALFARSTKSSTAVNPRNTALCSNSCRSWPKKASCGATEPRERTQQQLAGDLLQRAFGGSARNLLMGALSARKTSKRELVELRKLLDDYEREAT